MPRALISVSNKSGLLEFARGLVARGFDLISTGGTARALEEAGLDVIGVSEVTGFPEMMDGRVKTLHPLVHGGILARRGHPEDVAAAASHGIALIDLVVVNLYPFVEAAARPETGVGDLLEKIDIGGPSLVRAAAKNFQDVLVVVSPADYPAVLLELDRAGGPAPRFRLELAQRAFAHTGAYDTAIASTLAAVTADGDGFARDAVSGWPAAVAIGLRKVRDLRYGENPHQTGVWYREEPASGAGAVRVLQGKELSYTNLLDLDAATRIVLEFTEPAATVIKHTNPCGAATADRPSDAYRLARDADLRAAFGGVVGLNRPIDLETARALVSTFIEVVIAPAVEDEARSVLAAKSNLRVVTANFADLADHAGREFHSILGAVLAQDRDRVLEAASTWPRDDLRVVTERHPTSDEWVALRFAWRICSHMKSNAVIFTATDRTLAIGAGQTSRLDAVQVARMKAAEGDASPLAGSVVASDAFFPFRDGLDAAVAAGATAVVQPGGSVRDDEVVNAANEHGLAMVFTGRRHFRH